MSDVSAQKYLFYMHGKIVEDQGKQAVSPYFGAYQYEAILDTFRSHHFTVMSEVRKPNTDVTTYAREIKVQVDNLLLKGIPAKDITVVGASKGAIIAMLVSYYLQNSDVNFVFLAACNDDNFESFPDIKFYGNILSIYERSDDIGNTCARFKKASSATIRHYKEVEINTGLKHGFLFQPLSEWINPAIKWANGDYRQ